MNLDDIPDDLLLARGRYSTVRAMHEDQLKYLQILTGQLAAAGSQILRTMQPTDGEEADISALVAASHKTLEHIEITATAINELAEQRATLRPLAWPKVPK